jgi:hypothetical protein
MSWTAKKTTPTTAPASQDFPKALTGTGVTELSRRDTPAHLGRALAKRPFDILGVHQLDDLKRFKAWTAERTKRGGKDLWLWWGCPMALLDKAVSDGAPQSYGDFHAGVLGKDAVYLYANPGSAARAALRYGIDREGVLFSIRLVPGKVFKCTGGNPSADGPPEGGQTVHAARGVDLGAGAISHDLFAVWDGDGVLLRYATHIRGGG